MKECNCDLRTKLVGDGCEVCNPELALERARKTILEQEQTIQELIGSLEEIKKYTEDVWTWQLIEGLVDKALAKARGEL